MCDGLRRAPRGTPDERGTRWHSRVSSANERSGVGARPPPTMTAMVVGAGAGIAASYVLGTFPTAQLVGKRVGHDPTREGSGNPGASNVYRTAGRAAGALVLLGDAAKGAVPTAIALVASGRPLAAWCWVAAVLGHVIAIPGVRRGG